MDHTPRKLVFKAWNKETKLMMRLNAIDCRRGEIFKKDHILLQFTGLYDQQQEEIYEMDVMLIGAEKYVVLWDVQRNGWAFIIISNGNARKPFIEEIAAKAKRLWNSFESDKKV
jgi:hypothetical protein